MFKTGHVSLEQLNQCGLADSRIGNLVRDGHFEKVAYKQQGRVRECYKLTKFGRETAARNWGLERSYRAQSPAHDLALAEKYFSLPEEMRETWSTESQIRDRFMEQLSVLRDQGKEAEVALYEKMLERGLISMPDASYVNDNGETVAYETITNSYGEDELQAKETLVEIMNYQYETTRI